MIIFLERKVFFCRIKKVDVVIAGDILVKSRRNALGVAQVKFIQL